MSEMGIILFPFMIEVDGFLWKELIISFKNSIQAGNLFTSILKNLKIFQQLRLSRQPWLSRYLGYNATAVCSGYRARRTLNSQRGKETTARQVQIISGLPSASIAEKMGDSTFGDILTFEAAGRERGGGNASWGTTTSVSVGELSCKHANCSSKKDCAPKAAQIG